MLTGIEEEFIVVDRSNFFCAPLGPKILLKLISKNKRYISKSSLETPFARKKFSLNKNELIKGFSIVETKTSPQKDLDLIREEIILHRNNLIETAEDCNLAILPIGIHPSFSLENCGIECCAALHIHIPRRSEYYHNILGNIPQIIALTANSPFANGKHLGMSSRALFSTSIGAPNNLFERASDLIVNRHLGTTEIRVCDTQLFPQDVIDAVAAIHCIAKISTPRKITRSQYINSRRDAIFGGKEKVETKTLYDEIEKIAEELSLTDYVSNFFNKKTGAELQCECLRNNGLPTLLTSLWASMKKERFVEDRSNINLNTDINSTNFHKFLLIYSPILVFNILKKIRQDDAINTTKLFGKDPTNIKTEALFSHES